VFVALFVLINNLILFFKITNYHRYLAMQLLPQVFLVQQLVQIVNKIEYLLWLVLLVFVLLLFLIFFVLVTPSY